MAGKVNFRKSARLEWTDISKITSGVGYLRGKPYYEGNLADVVLMYFELPRSSRATAVIRTDPQTALQKNTLLRPNDIEALKRREDFPNA